MRKNFPFYTQHDNMQYGITCLQMICKYYGTEPIGIRKLTIMKKIMNKIRRTGRITIWLKINWN